MVTTIENVNSEQFQLNVSGTIQDNFVFDANAQKQLEIIQNLDFEYMNRDIHFSICSACRSKFFFKEKDIALTPPTLCKTCVDKGYTLEKLLRKNILPVWYRKDDIHKKNPQFHQPKALRDLEEGEKLLIQLKSLHLNTKHIKNGQYGAYGHSVCFATDMESVCNILPRKREDTLTLLRYYTKKGEDIPHVDKFKIRRKKVLKALKWLKNHHPSYKDITIDEDNLSWMGEKEECSLVTEAEVCELKEAIEEPETVSETQTGVNLCIEEQYGLALNQTIDKANEETKEILDSLKEETEFMDSMDFPQVSEKAINEHIELNMFADCYPWLFPGGLGDPSLLVKESFDAAIEWASFLLRYYDGRFATDESLTFHLLNFIQRHVNNRDALWFVKDNFCAQDVTVEDLRRKVDEGDFTFVSCLQNYASYSIRGSDPWWRSRKHELDSWIAHHLEQKHGPPTLFMTFSCAEYWWEDLLVFLEKRCAGTDDAALVEKVKTCAEADREKIKSELLFKYSYCVQEFFQLRMDNWLETIGKNVYKIKHYYLRFEFAKGRGQIHAHMLAITEDYGYIHQFHEEYCKKQNICEGTKIYADYAKKTLSLTAEKPVYDKAEAKKLRAPANFFSEADDLNLDLGSLLEIAHMHKCNRYCLRENMKNSKVRECRAGCGKEQTPGQGDTPGFPLHTMDKIEHDIRRDIKILKLRRNDSRMTQTSTSMLQSWRANCDLSVIVYDTDPTKLSPQDIAKISGYIVSYCTKGNASYQKEQESICKVVSQYDDDLLSGDTLDAEKHVLKLSKRVLNSFLTSRIISKAEACFELLKLELYWCTESFCHIRTSRAIKLMKEKKPKKGQQQENYNFEDTFATDAVSRYMSRADTFEEFSLHDFVTYCSKMKQDKALKVPKDPEDLQRLRMRQKTLKTEILHPVGLNGHPCFPISHGYCKSTLIMHKPWSPQKPLKFDKYGIDYLYKEFLEFLMNPECPDSVLLKYHIAQENHKRSKKAGQIEQEIITFDGVGGFSDNMRAFLQALHRTRLYLGDYENCYKGQDGYDFQSQYSLMDPHNLDRNWLSTQKKAFEEQNANRKPQPTINANFERPYNIDDVENNMEQSEIVYSVIKKLKEWIEFPDKHSQDPSTTFEPLLLTVNGEGGTGKSHVIKVITNIVESIFEERVTVTCAPTGNAAYNVGGKTCHSFFGLQIKKTSKKMTMAQEEKLDMVLKRLLLVMIDERSLLSTENLAEIQHNCVRLAHGGNKHLPWGGIPIVILLGDDKQLPSVTINNSGIGATKIFDERGDLNDSLLKKKEQMIGARHFQTIGSDVITLLKNNRNKNDQILKKYCKALRDDQGLTQKDANNLLKFRYENPELSVAKRNILLDEAIWIYATKKEVKQHNIAMLEGKVSKSNPLMCFTYKIGSSSSNHLNSAKEGHFDSKNIKAAGVSLCRGCRVSIDRNIWQEVGLFNGAMGTVIDIRMDPNKSPLRGDLPAYVIVEMDTYDGPIWDKSNPKQIPIPIWENSCERVSKCCTMECIPLEVSFARTLHKFQGQSVGPSHYHKYMVFGPGTATFEANNPGLLYVGLSRVETLGPNIEEGHFYFTGFDATVNRLTNVTHKRGTNGKPTKEKYKAVVCRDRWLNYLHSHVRKKHTFIPDEEKFHLKQWLQHSYFSKVELDRTIIYHNNNRCH